jgi:hypothetical protein
VIADYHEFIRSKSQEGLDGGFEPQFLPDFLFDFQRSLVQWAVRKGRAAIFADCGLGKTAMQLVWAENVRRETGKPVLILTPLAVGAQTVAEAHKFRIEAAQSRDGRIESPIVVTNYQRLHYFDREKFGGVVCDESSILKNFDGAIKSAVTEFMRKTQYRFLCTATAAPNDHIELGTSSEALGYLGFMDMLSKFFKKAEATTSRSDEFRSGVYRFRGHAKEHFWRWVCSWARAVRRPSDLGFDDRDFVLPLLQCVEHVVSAATPRTDMLFDLPAVTLGEQRQERKRTLNERCELAAQLCAEHKGASVAWCHLNPEGDLLEKLIPNCVQVSGDDSDDAKEEKIQAFTTGQVENLVSKSSICGFGMNWQHCHHTTSFPSHSFEQWYQAVRRFLRFGQKHAVRMDMITSEGEVGVLRNLNRKAAQADEMFRQLVKLINGELKITRADRHKYELEMASWL